MRGHIPDNRTNKSSEYYGWSYYRDIDESSTNGFCNRRSIDKKSGDIEESRKHKGCFWWENSGWYKGCNRIGTIIAPIGKVKPKSNNDNEKNIGMWYEGLYDVHCKYR